MANVKEASFDINQVILGVILPFWQVLPFTALTALLPDSKADIWLQRSFNHDLNK